MRNIWKYYRNSNEKMFDKKPREITSSNVGRSYNNLHRVPASIFGQTLCQCNFAGLIQDYIQM